MAKFPNLSEPIEIIKNQSSATNKWQKNPRFDRIKS